MRTNDSDLIMMNTNLVGKGKQMCANYSEQVDHDDSWEQLIVHVM